MKVIKFTKIRYVMFIFSLLLIAGGLVLAFTKGPNWGIDFLNGLNMTVSVKKYDTTINEYIPATIENEGLLIEEVRGWFSALDNAPEVQLQSKEAARYAIRTVFTDDEEADLGKDPAELEMDRLSEAMESAGVQVVQAGVYEEGLVDPSQRLLVVIESSQSSSPDWTENSWKQLVILLLVALLLITIYIWVRFTWGFALAAMTALVHDVFIMIGFLCIAPFEVSKTTIAALLTIIGYSLNDTIVVFDTEILGKPKDKEDARQILSKLSGKVHEVKTAVAILTSNQYEVFVSTTKVKMSQITDEEIETYIETGEPMDKAGAYGIHGYGARFIESIEGDYYTVMGLPINMLYQNLKRFL